MCSQETAERILTVVRNLPEAEPRKVLRFAESLSRVAAEEMPLEEFIRSLPTISAFQGEPLDLQEALRREWD